MLRIVVGGKHAYDVSMCGNERFPVSLFNAAPIAKLVVSDDKRGGHGETVVYWNFVLETGRVLYVVCLLIPMLSELLSKRNVWRSVHTRRTRTSGTDRPVRWTKWAIVTRHTLLDIHRFNASLLVIST